MWEEKEVRDKVTQRRRGKEGVERGTGTIARESCTWTFVQGPQSP